MSTPVHVIGGFLGTGKTTAVRRLLADRADRERIAVVVNDFGEARIDALALDAGPRIVSIEGGCVCCTAPDGLPAAILALLDEVAPDRIVIEPSGLARPHDVVDMLTRGPVAARVEVRPTIVLVDPAATPAGPAAALADEAWSAADVLVANRCDLASPAAVEAFRARASARWPAPLRVVETSFGVLPDDVFAPAPAHGAHDHAGHDHAGHDHAGHDHAGRDHAPSTTGFSAASAVLPREVVLAWDALAELLAAPSLERFKGVVRTDAGWLRVERAGGRVTAEPTAWRRDSRWDVIVAGTDAAALSDALASARWSADAAPTDCVELLGIDGEPRALSRAALAALPGQVPDVSAVVPGREGAGVALRDVLALVSPPPGARFSLAAGDGLTAAPTPVDDVGDAVLVHSLGGGPLPAKQGGPFRVLAAPAPGRSACANVKGVVRIRVLPAAPTEGAALAGESAGQ